MYGKNIRRRKRRRDELGRVVAVLHNVDLLAAELGDDIGNAGASRADARADRVYIRVMAYHRKLGAGARFAGNGLDFDNAVVNFGNLGFKQALHQVGMGAADHGAGALFRLFHVHHVHLDVVALAQLLVADLLAFGQHGLGLADFQRSRSRTGVYALHERGDQLLIFALELLHHLAALAVANALADDVSGRLRGDSAKLLGIQRHVDLILHAGGGVNFSGLRQRNFLARVLDLLDDRLAQEHFKVAAGGIHVDERILVAVAVLTRGQNCLLDFIQHKIDRDAPFLFQQIQSLKNFAVHLNLLLFKIVIEQTHRCAVFLGNGNDFLLLVAQADLSIRQREQLPVKLPAAVRQRANQFNPHR